MDHVPHRLPRTRRRHAAFRLLQQGRDPGGATAQRDLLGVRGGRLGFTDHRVLHDAALLPSIRRAGARRAPARGPSLDGRSDGCTCHSHGASRLRQCALRRVPRSPR